MKFKEIAEANPHKGQIRSTETGPMWDKRMLKAEAWKEGATFVFAIPEIKEGQELREKAKSGKLCEKVDLSEFADMKENAKRVWAVPLASGESR